MINPVKPKAGRPRKLASLRVYVSANTIEESRLIGAMEARKSLDPSFNIGEHLLALAVKGANAVPSDNVSLSNETINKLTESIAQKIVGGLSNSVIVSGLTNLINDSETNPPITSKDNNTLLAPEVSVPYLDKIADNITSENDIDNTEQLNQPSTITTLPANIATLKKKPFF